MIALLDVNVLVALFDPDHVHHDAAHAWFGERETGWATCPVVENGVVRILSNPAYSPAHVSAAEARDRLEELCSTEGHVFWPDDVSLRDGTLFDLAGARHAQVTDVYLLGLAVRRGGALATFDRHVPLLRVRGATPDRLLVLRA